MSRGVTLVEITSVSLIVGTLTAIAIPPARRYLDRAAVSAAADRFAAVHEVTRGMAIAKGRLARYEVDKVTATLTLSVKQVGGAWDTLARYPVGERVKVTASQRTVTFAPIGIGYGASNTTVTFARGAAAETLTVSRTGRLRRR